jgi:hypothetical protein
VGGFGLGLSFCTPHTWLVLSQPSPLPIMALISTPPFSTWAPVLTPSCTGPMLPRAPLTPLDSLPPRSPWAWLFCLVCIHGRAWAVSPLPLPPGRGSVPSSCLPNQPPTCHHCSGAVTGSPEPARGWTGLPTSETSQQVSSLLSSSPSLSHQPLGGKWPPAQLIRDAWKLPLLLFLSLFYLMGSLCPVGRVAE